MPPKFNTVIFPAPAHADRELKLDIVEQAYHVLQPGGVFITLSEYDKDNLFHKAHKNRYGKCSEVPVRKLGTAFWSKRPIEDVKRRRHRMTFHASCRDGISMAFESWPGTFSYGEFDPGSRALLEVADLRQGDKVLDLGCGNGAVGCLASQSLGSTGSITFVDSNTRAMKLAELNAEANSVQNAKFMTSSTLDDLPTGAFDVVLANPPYFANSEVGRLFITTAREVLRPGGRFYFVTKMPVRTIPEIVETFGQVESIENRGYTVVIAYA
jgi:16S rRNA (guanine1207-N2)-methyltransferase